jgi:CDP-diacylglycerol--glycerol-3-phosphate 3-phosphatidyltransferase
MISLAHIMTFLRIVLVPFFPIFYFWGSSFGIDEKVVPFILLALLIVCQISDILDGKFARRRNEVTDLGKVLDPMADSLLSLTVLFTFTTEPISLPVILIFVFLYREFSILALRLLCGLKGHALAARSSGKIKTVLQAAVFFLIVLLMIANQWNIISLLQLQWTSFYAVLVAAFYTAISACEYFYASRRFLFKSLNSKGK